MTILAAERGPKPIPTPEILPHLAVLAKKMGRGALDVLTITRRMPPGVLTVALLHDEWGVPLPTPSPKPRHMASRDTDPSRSVKAITAKAHPALHSQEVLYSRPDLMKIGMQGVQNLGDNNERRVS